MNTLTVSNAAELRSALNSARPGDEILLEAGDYGTFNFDGYSYSDYVTIRSADGNLGAKFDAITVIDSTYIRIDGVHVDSPSNGAPASKLVTVDGGSRHIEFLNSEVNGLVDNDFQGHYGLHVSNATDVRFEGNNVHDVKNGIVAISADNLVIAENKLDYLGNDGMKFSGVQDVLIENNFGPGHVFPAPGAHLDFIQFQGSDSSDIVVRGNVLLPQTPVTSQGIFFDDAHYTNILIENNIIYNALVRAISISSGSNITAQNNTTFTVPGVGHKAAAIILPSGSTSQNNIIGSNQDGFNGSNLFVEWDSPNSLYGYDNVFANASAGWGVTLEDLRPVAGGPADFGSGLGAAERLQELLDGVGSVPSPAPNPSPEGFGPVPNPAPNPSPEDVGPVSNPAPNPSPEPETLPEPTSGPGFVFYIEGVQTFSGSAANVIELDHRPSLEVNAATISFSFNADTINGSLGLFSKDATFFSGGGNHFTSYIKNGVLTVRYQDGQGEQTFTVPGIQARQEYAFVASFGGGEVALWLNGVQIGTANFDTNWQTNTEYLQIGANGWSSASGASGFVDIFDGTISDIVIAEGVLTPDEVADLPLADNLSDPLFLIGDDNANTLVGGNADDYLQGGGGQDVLDGGMGIDTANYADSYGAVWIDLATGEGRWNTAEGDTLNGIEKLIGSDVGDRLFGDDGANVLNGGRGGDTLDGRGGIDTVDFSGQIGGVYVDLKLGFGQWYSAAGDTFANVENITGTDFTDRLLGDDGYTILRGAAGSDYLNARGGFNYLFGGADADRFAFTNDATDNSFTYIMDFSRGSGDVIDMTAFDGNELLSGRQGTVWTSTFDGRAGLGVIDYDAANDRTTIRLDVDGDTATDLTISAGGKIEISDFLWV